MNTPLLKYDEARVAIRDGKDPMAFLHLGIIYAKGLGITENHRLANYFFDKALAMGCHEAARYIDMEYELEKRNVMADVLLAVHHLENATPEKMAKIKQRLEKERQMKWYGHLSALRDHLSLFYPDYNREKAITDILEGRETVDADLLYALSTHDNRMELYMDMVDRFLSQLFVPITSDKGLFQRIIDDDNINVLTSDENELLLCLENFSSYYDRICSQYNIDKKELLSLDDIELYPCICMSTLALLRRQVFRCLLSVKDLDPLIAGDFLDALQDDEKLLEISEGVSTDGLSLFLISFVEMNIDLDAIETTYIRLKRAFIEGNLEPLASFLNGYAERLTNQGIEHQLPKFTTSNLPAIHLNLLIS